MRMSVSMTPSAAVTQCHLCQLGSSHARPFAAADVGPLMNRSQDPALADSASIARAQRMLSSVDGHLRLPDEGNPGAAAGGLCGRHLHCIAPDFTGSVFCLHLYMDSDHCITTLTRQVPHPDSVLLQCTRIRTKIIASCKSMLAPWRPMAQSSPSRCPCPTGSARRWCRRQAGCWGSSAGGPRSRWPPAQQDTSIVS